MMFGKGQAHDDYIEHTIYNLSGGDPEKYSTMLDRPFEDLLIWSIVDKRYRKKHG